MRPLVVAAMAAAALGAALLPVASAGAANGNGPKGGFTMAVYGDSPYEHVVDASTSTGQVEATPAFITDINNDPDVSLVLHVGDIHSGKDFCSLGYDQQIAADWAAFQDPLVYTPGDNEWADCHKSGEGSQPPLANLGYVRDIFFHAPGQTLGRENMHVTSQATAYDRAHPEDKQFIENVMFERKGVMFVTLDIPGGSNNDLDAWTAPNNTPADQTAQHDERVQRTAADLRWLDTAFANATAAGDNAVVIMQQADMWDLDSKTSAHLDHYSPFVASIASHTVAFNKPVLLFEGDSHKYRTDNPLKQGTGSNCTIEAPTLVDVLNEATCTDDAWANQPAITSSGNPEVPDFTQPNVADTLFHRVVVHGSSSPMQWLKVTVDLSANYAPGTNQFGPFTWERHNTGLGA